MQGSGFFGKVYEVWNEKDEESRGPDFVVLSDKGSALHSRTMIPPLTASQLKRYVISTPLYQISNTGLNEIWETFGFVYGGIGTP